MSEEYICPLGCLIRINHRSEKEAHNQKHLTNILTLLRYRSDLIKSVHLPTYNNIVVMIEEGMQK